MISGSEGIGSFTPEMGVPEIRDINFARATEAAGRIATAVWNGTGDRSLTVDSKTKAYTDTCPEPNPTEEAAGCQPTDPCTVVATCDDATRAGTCDGPTCEDDCGD